MNEYEQDRAAGQKGIRYSTDHPGNSRSFLPAAEEWSPFVAPARDRAALQTLWTMFADADSIWSWVESSDSVDSESCREMLIVDHAATSQFDTIVTALNQGIALPDGLICLALAGERHRGQRERPWMAIRGNLHFTTHLRLDRPVSEVEAIISMVPAVAAARAIDAATPIHCRPRIKWVNDVLVDDCKVAGGLTATHLCGDRVESVVFGIGINVAVAPDLGDSACALPAGCLAPFGVGLADLTHALIAALDQQVGALSQGQALSIHERYRQYAGFIGRLVHIWPEGSDLSAAPEPVHTGRVIDVLPDLSLRLDCCPDPVRGGRMTFASPSTG